MLWRFLLDKMPSLTEYSPVRSVIILVLSFLLPLLITSFSGQLSANVEDLWRFSSKSSAGPSIHNATSQTGPLLALDRSVSSSKVLFRPFVSEALTNN